MADPKEDAAREAAVFDGMLPGWHKHYANDSAVMYEEWPRRDSLWHILLLRREPELVEHLAREICSRLLSDSLDELTLRRAIQEVRRNVSSVQARRTANSQQEVSIHEKD